MARIINSFIIQLNLFINEIKQVVLCYVYDKQIIFISSHFDMIIKLAIFEFNKFLIFLK